MPLGEQKMSNPVDENATEKDVRRPPKSSQHPQQLSAEDSKPPPATPVGRVPLAELLGNNEDAFEQRPALTPVERVLWNHSPSSTDFANSLMTPAMRREKKRGRSSSPPSSSRENALDKAPTFDLQTLQRSLTTPLADPAGDLWSRYSINTKERPTPSKPAVQPLHDLLQSSSPQTPARYLRENDSSGLRRTVSCGTAWPTSAAKRRKIQKSHSQVVDRSIHGPVENHYDIGVSKVSFLLGKIHEGLAHIADVSDEMDPSSSSPPALNGAADLRASPSERLLAARQIPPPAAASVRSLENKPPEEHVMQEAQVPEAKMQTPQKDSSSDYGDDTIDVDFFDEVSASMQRPGPSKDITRGQADEVIEDHVIEHPEENNRLRAGTTVGTGVCLDSRKDFIDDEIGTLKESDSEAVNNKSQRQGNDDFEFDDDQFAADMEDMAAMYDEQVAEVTDRAPTIDADLDLPPNPKLSVAKDFPWKTVSTAVAPGRAREYAEVSSDDEFGGGFELEELACELTHATQAVEAASSLLVRTSYKRSIR